MLNGCPYSPPLLRHTLELPFIPSQPIDIPKTLSQFNRAISAFFYLESPLKRISLGDKLIKSFYVLNLRRAFVEEQYKAILDVEKRQSQRLAINLALSINRVNILSYKQMEEAQTIEVEIIIKIRCYGTPPQGPPQESPVLLRTPRVQLMLATRRYITSLRP